MGQGSADLSEVSLEQLGNIKVYSASKHMQYSSDAPASVTVITADDIQQHGYRTLAELLQSVRGFFTTSDRNYSNLGVRGFARPGDFNTRILLLVDGHRLNDNVYDQAMIGTEFPLDLDLIQRIEIIRGPVSSLYGSNALFAVVNIITRRGQELNGLEVSAEAASFNTYEGRISYGRKVQQAEFLLSGTFYGSRGHNRLFYPEYDIPATNNGIASHADGDQVGSSLATISSRDFTLQSLYGTREKGIPTGAYGTLFNNSGTRTTDARAYVDLRYRHTFDNSWDVLARSFYDRYIYHGTYMYASPIDSTQLSPNKDFADGKWWGAELQLTSKPFRRNHVTAGGEYRDNIRQDQTNYSLNPYSLLLKDRRKSFVGAVYAQDELTITKALTLNAGLRYDYYSHIDSSMAPRAALLYRPRSQTALKFIYGQSFRVPNVYELYYSILPNVPNPRLRPEKIRTTEFIWEERLTHQFWFSSSVFHNSIKNLITQEATAGDFLIFQNLPEAKSTGVELEIRGQLSNGFEAGASYSFQKTQDSVHDTSLNNSPESLIKLNLSQPVWHRRIFASLDGNYRSRMQLPTGGYVSGFTVLSATLLGRRIGKDVDLSASVYNLLDKRYFDPSSGVTLSRAIQQDGRSFRVKVTWHIGER
jgi:outer membrane receptor for ferrienterochelin and colicins